MPNAPRKACTVSGCLGYAEVIGRCRAHASPILASRERARESEAGRAWYHTTRWRALRARVLAKSPTCVECMARENRAVPATDVDHIQAHRGDLQRFWDAKNLQTLCAPCHNRKTAMERGAAVSRLPENPRG